MTDTAALPTLPEPFFHDDSGAVRFWVRSVAGDAVGASIPKQVLHFRFKAGLADGDALPAYRAHRSAIDAAVLRRLAAGSREPVLLREPDLG